MRALVARRIRRTGYPNYLRDPNSVYSRITQQRKSDCSSEGKCEIQDPNKKEFTERCLFCSAEKFEEKDLRDGINARRTAAAVSLLSKSNKWSTFPTDQIFEFIYTLDQRLQGHADMKKELSYYGAIRSTRAEVETAMVAGQLTSYYVEKTYDTKGTAFCRMSMDPMNQVYAGWLVTIAGKMTCNLGTTKREKLGDMVETALGPIPYTHLTLPAICHC